MSSKDRILIVDDNPESIWSLVEFLEIEYEIQYATKAEKAFNIVFSSDPPDVILLDVIMPDMDGYEFFLNLKKHEQAKDIPVIFITALTELEHEVKGLEIGAKDYIIKPFRLPVVSARIKTVLNLKKEMDRRLLLKRQLETVNQQLESQVKAKMKEFHEAKQTLIAYEEKYNYLFKTDYTSSALKTVLAVDDNPENLHILIEALEQEYTVLYATTGKKALEIANSSDRPDVILLDVVMPEIDGYEVCSMLKANAGTWDIPVIFITSLDQEIDETRGLNLGAVDFIAKPFSMPVLKARIKAALRLKEEMDTRIVLTRKLEDLNKNLELRVREKTLALEQAHDDLAVSEKRYRTLYETAIEGIFETSPQGKMLSASPSLARMLGYESSQDLISNMKDLAIDLYENPEDRVRFRAELEEKGQVINFETRFKRRQGDIIWVLLCARHVLPSSEQPGYYQGFIIDITKQKMSQLENIQHLKELRLLNKVIAASVIETRCEGILETACKELSNAFGLSCMFAGLIDIESECIRIAVDWAVPGKEEVENKESFVNVEISSKANPFINKIIALDTPLVIHDIQSEQGLTPVRHLIEKFKIASILIIPLKNEGQSIGVLALGSSDADFFNEAKVNLVQSVVGQISIVMSRIMLDENRRQLEKQYYQSQKMEAIGTLTGGVAHDFSNILTVIFSVINLMKLKLEPKSELFPKLKQMESAATRAAELVRQLLVFSRQQILHPTRLNLSYIVDVFEKMLKRIIGEDIELVVDLEPDIYKVRADQGQIEQVLMNLVVNARDAMPKGGCLTIETRNVTLDEAYASLHHGVKPGDYAMVSVSDTGLGIEKSIQNHIFEPFFTTKSKGKGTGLGLATVHGIVTQSGGHIWMHSELDQGTWFKVYLPRYEKKDQKDQYAKRIENSKEMIKGTESVLIVEDDEELCELICDTLTEFGYQVRTAASGPDASKIFSSSNQEFDLFLSDVIIPGDENGVQLAKRLNKIKPDMKVLFMSGYTDNAIVRHCVLELGLPFIQKPFVPRDLAYKIRQVIES